MIALALALVGCVFALAVWDTGRRALEVQRDRSHAASVEALSARVDALDKRIAEAEAMRKDLRAIRDQLGARR